MTSQDKQKTNRLNDFPSLLREACRLLFVQRSSSNAITRTRATLNADLKTKLKSLSDFGTGIAGVLSLTVLLTIFCVPLSYVPARAESGDGSVSAVLAYEHAHHLQFGKDIVYTYGPAGFLLHPYCTGYMPWLSMACQLFVGLATSLGICLLAARLEWMARATLLGAFVIISSNINSGPDLLVYTGIFCWGLLAWTESGRRLSIVLVPFLALLCLGALE